MASPRSPREMTASPREEGDESKMRTLREKLETLALENRVVRSARDLAKKEIKMLKSNLE